MKKFTSLILCVIILCTSLFTFAVRAQGSSTKGPNPDYDYACVALERVMYDTEGFYYTVLDTIYSNSESYHNLDGLSYDKESNTVTLCDFNEPEATLSLNQMGSDLTIAVKGECSLGSIYSWAGDYAGDITVKGSGTLTLNEKKVGSYAIFISASGTPSVLTVKNSVTLNIYAESSDPVILTNDTALTSAEDFLIIEGQTSREINPVLTSYPIYENDDITAYVPSAEKISAFSASYYNGDKSEFVFEEYWDSEELMGGSPSGYTRYLVRRVEGRGAYAEYFGQCTDADLERWGLELSQTLSQYSVLNEFYLTKYVRVADEEEIYCSVDFDESDNILKVILTEYDVEPYGDEGYFATERCKVTLPMSDFTDESVYREYQKYLYDQTDIKLEGVTELHITPNENMEFVDVKENSWYYSGVKYCYLNGFMSGTDASHFSPDMSLTRAQIVVILAAMSGADLTCYTNKYTFNDVKAGWYHNAVEWAYSRGITGGVGDGKFNPGGKLTRQDLCVMLMKYASLKGADTAERADITGYSDYRKISSYAVNAMSWAAAKGLVSGTTAKTLSPKGTATRAMASLIIAKLDQKD